MKHWNLLGGENGFLLSQVFHGGDFGHAYRLILVWPLNIYGLFADKITTFWLMGDEYRTLAPHGPKAKKWENIGQWVLLAAFIITGLKLLAVLGGFNIPIINTPRPFLLDVSRMIYSIVVDVIFAGVLGVGIYFFLSGRVWCRFFCPLAALMHIYTRFSRYRIFQIRKNASLAIFAKMWINNFTKPTRMNYPNAINPNGSRNCNNSII